MIEINWTKNETAEQKSIHRPNYLQKQKGAQELNTPLKQQLHR